MKTLYLHIGTSKTGTTAIQNFCDENQTVLNRYGYTYPDFHYYYKGIARVRNARFLLGQIFHEDGTRDYEEEARRFDEAFDIIYEAFNTYDNVVISDEAIWSYGLRDGVWEKLSKELQKGKFVIKVVVYFRPQEEYLYSWWDQRIKTGLLVDSRYTWEEIQDRFTKVTHPAYYSALEQVAKYVGKENILVRVFNKNRFVEGSIYADFLQTIGLKYSDEYQIGVENRNLTLSKNANEIKRILNGVPGLDEKMNNRFRNILLQQTGDNPEKISFSMFSKEELADFREKYREENEKIAREYLRTDEPLFEYSTVEKKKWTPEEAYMMADVVLFFGTMYLQMDNEIKQLKEELKKNDKAIEYLQDIMKHPIQALKRKAKKIGK